LTYVRNICAHHGRLWDRELSVKPELLREWKIEGISNTHVFCIFLVLHHILDSVEPNSRWKDSLMRHLLDHPQVDLKRMGFAEGWQRSAPWNVSPVMN
jgi:abortive infection bacteriophage resistance protein